MPVLRRSTHRPGRLGPYLLLIALAPLEVSADWAQARCEIVDSNDVESIKVVPCVFNQRQGYINIDFADGGSLDLEPTGDSPGKFLDQDGEPVSRRLPDDGNSQVFTAGNREIKVLWTALSARRTTRDDGTFDETLVYQGISFRIESLNKASLNLVTISAAGLERGPAKLKREADGAVSGAEVADLDNDGSPELYIYTNSAGSGSYGGLIGFAVNKRKSMSDIYLPPVDGEQGGYMGHDEFAVVEQSLIRRFPLYRPEDTNAEPTGGYRQIQYRLIPGEAGWLLESYKTVDY